MGGLSDRIGRKPTAAVAMAVQALSFMAFLLSHTLPVIYTTAVAFGFSYGTISALFPAVVGDFFGREQAGAIVGFLFALAGSMAAGGPVAAGAIYDATGSYRLAFHVSAAFNVAAMALMLLCHAPRALPVVIAAQAD
jgi:MFS family permease